MMELKFGTTVGLTFGIVLTLGTFWRYYVIYPDIDRALMYPLIGVLFMVCAWWYNMLRLETDKRETETSELKKSLDSLKFQYKETDDVVKNLVVKNTEGGGEEVVENDK